VSASGAASVCAAEVDAKANVVGQGSWSSWFGGGGGGGGTGGATNSGFAPALSSAELLFDASPHHPARYAPAGRATGSFDKHVPCGGSGPARDTFFGGHVVCVAGGEGEGVNSSWLPSLPSLDFDSDVSDIQDFTLSA